MPGLLICRKMLPFAEICKEKEWSEVYMQMAQGIGIVFMVVWAILTIFGIVAAVFMIIAFWKAMRAHESIAGSMKEIADSLQAQARAAALAKENKDEL